MKKTLLTACFAALALGASAQYITKTPAGGFNLAGAKDFVVLYAPGEAIAGMEGRILTNNNLDSEQKNNQFYYWTCDWDKKLLQICNYDEEGVKNSFGGADYLNIVPLFDWGGGGFASKGDWKYDLSKVTDEHYVHIGLRDFSPAGTKQAKFQFQFGPLGKIKTNGFCLQVNNEVGAASGDYVGVGSVGQDGQWYSIDIPVKDLVDPDGDFGFEYDFSQPISDHIFTVTFKDATVAKETHFLEPGAEVNTYDITELHTGLSLDCIFFYVPTGETGITSIANGQADTQTYDLQGRRVNEGTQGVHIVKTANGVKKVIR